MILDVINNDNDDNIVIPSKIEGYPVTELGDNCFLYCVNLKFVKIPKFSIQLLVENGIKHGYLGKELNIYIKFDKNSIKVSNDGKKSSNIKFKTGLSNLENRLKILNIGKLEYISDNENIAFSIILKDKS